MANWSEITSAGTPSRAHLYSRICDSLRQVQEDCAMMAHLHNTESNDMDKVLAKGWLGMSELVARLIAQITKLAMNKLS